MRQMPPQTGAIVISTIIVLGFSLMLWVILWHEVPTANATLATTLLGMLATLAGQVGNYWLGSSSSAARKDHQLSEAQDALAMSTPSDQYLARRDHDGDHDHDADHPQGG